MFILSKRSETILDTLPKETRISNKHGDILLIFYEIICCRYSLEASIDASSEYPQHVLEN